jgi:hypothetical protein
MAILPMIINTHGEDFRDCDGASTRSTLGSAAPESTNEKRQVLAPVGRRYRLALLFENSSGLILNYSPVGPKFSYLPIARHQIPLSSPCGRFYSKILGLRTYPAVAALVGSRTLNGQT